MDAQAPETRQIKIVDFRSGEAVIRHPDLVYYVKQGWRIESAVPHVIESEEVKLLVVLSRGAGTLSASAQD